MDTELINAANGSWWQNSFNGQKTEQEYNAYQQALAREWQSQENQKEREFNSSEAQKTRDYQAYMSNTAYQRGVQDMQKAGLNPYLAYSQGSASTPVGSNATSSAHSASSGASFKHNGGVFKVLSSAFSLASQMMK